jgi:hypothetical protein
MKKLIIAIASLSILASCAEQEVVTPSVLVKPVNAPEIYYGEILHKNMYKVGDTLRITYNQMPKHEWAWPHANHTKYVSVVLISK